ncbi:MAG: LPS assembly lipoprotein LptE [Bdellovibrionales bacterium]
MASAALGVICSILVSCAYRFGYTQRDLPFGHKLVAIPVFLNVTQQVGIEGLFTNELIKQFHRSQVAVVTDIEHAPISIQGKILSIKYVHGGQVDANKADENTLQLPPNTVLTVEYRVLLDAEIVIKNKVDSKILWQGRFNNERVYSAPQVGGTLNGSTINPAINSVNPIYNQSARMEVFEQMAQDMMAEAHDRMTENF